MSKPAIFISYSHKDEKWKDRLVTQLGVLEQQGTFEVWNDREIGAGEDWSQKIDEALLRADVAILLVSAEFLTSPFILKEEVVRLLKRRDMEGLRIIPIIIKDCAWQQVKWLAQMQARPRDGRALETMGRAAVNTELMKIVMEIAEVLPRTSSEHRP